VKAEGQRFRVVAVKEAKPGDPNGNDFYQLVPLGRYGPMPKVGDVLAPANLDPKK
jgi:hypothetical protein